MDKIFEKHIHFPNLTVQCFTSKAGDTFYCVTIGKERFLLPKNLTLPEGSKVELILILTSDGYYRTYFNL